MADAPSRLKTTGDDQMPLYYDLPLFSLVVDCELRMMYTLHAHDGWPNVSHGDLEVGEAINLVESTSILPTNIVSVAPYDMMTAQIMDAFLHAKCAQDGNNRNNVRH